MKEGKFDAVQLAMQPYVMTLLKSLHEPKRFNDLVKLVKSRRTLTLRLSKLMKNELIEYYPLKTTKGYANAYIISKKGKDLLKGLEKL